MRIVCILLLAFQLVFLLRMVMSFFPIGSGSPTGRLRDLTVVLTDPVILPLRQRVPRLPGAMAGFGVAEIIVLIALQILLRIVC